MSMKKFQHEEVFRGYILQTDLRVASALAFSVQWPEELSVKEHFCYFNKISQAAKVVQACNFIIKRLQHGCFPVKFSKFWRTPPVTAFKIWILLESSHSEALYLLGIPLTTNKT